MKDKNLLIVGVIILVVLVAGGYYFFGIQKSSKKANTDTTISQDAIIPTLSVEEIGLTLEASPNGKQVKFIIAKADGIKLIEYELTYDADIPPDQQLEGAEEGQKVTRAATGEADLEGDSSYESKYLDLGTCSSGTCRYDTGVASVKLILKITKTDGKVYSAEASLEL